MQAKHLNDMEPKSDRPSRNPRAEFAAIVLAVALAVAIGVILDSIVLGFVAILCIGIIGLLAIRLFGPRHNNRTSALGPRGDGAHAHQQH